MAKVGNIKVKINFDGMEFNRGITSMRRDLRTLSKEAKTYTSQSLFKGDVKGLKQMEASLAGYKTAVAQAKTQWEQAEAALQQGIKAKVDSTELATLQKDVDDAKRQYVDLQSSVNKAYAEMEAAKKAFIQTKIDDSGFTKLGNALTTVGGKITSFGDQTKKLGNNLMPVSLGIGTALAGVVKAATDYETAFTGIRKTGFDLDDMGNHIEVSATKFDKLSGKLKQLSEEIPVSATALASIGEIGGQLGIPIDKLNQFTEVVGKLGMTTSINGEEGASALATFATLTEDSMEKANMGIRNFVERGTTDFGRVGATVVELGNNFNTTESDILAMATRISGAGHQIGLSQSEILGFSTTLSSLGVSAEMGGTAFSKMMTMLAIATNGGTEAIDNLTNATGKSLDELQVLAENGGDAFDTLADSVGMSSDEMKDLLDSSAGLNQFAEVAGMTSDKFSQMFKDDPAQALNKFIDGLSGMSEEGRSTLSILQDLDINEARLRDTSLRLGGGHDIATQAIKMANEAYKENSALNEEVSTRMEDTAAQFGVLKNQAINVAIELGTAMLPALKDMMNSAKPLIKTVGELAQKFADLPKGTQSTIVKFLALSVAAAPILTIFGGIASGAGQIITTFGKVSLSIGKLSGTFRALKALGGGTSLFGGLLSGAGTSTAAVAGLGTSLAAIAAPAAIAVAAIGAVGFAAYAVKKSYEEGQLAGEKWGTAVTKEQDKAIEKSKQLNEDGVLAVANYADGVTTSAKKVEEANNKIVDSIQKTIDKENKRLKESAKGLDDPEQQKRAEEHIQQEIANNQKLVDQAKVTTEAINKIVANASEYKRDLSYGETQAIAENYKKLSNDQLKALGFNKAERLAIETTYQSDVNKLTYDQQNKRIIAIEQGLAKEQKSYKSQVKDLANIYGEGTEEYNKELKVLNQNHEAATSDMILAMVKLRTAQGTSLSEMDGMWEQYGWTTEKVAKLVKSTGSANTKEFELMGKLINKLGKDWNDFDFDPKTGKITVEGREELLQATMEAGEWGLLTFDEKKLLVDGDEARLAFLNTLSDGEKWEQYNILTKELGVDNWKAIQAIIESEDGLNRWNQFSVEDKEFLAKNDQLLKVLLGSEDALTRYNNLPANEKELLANNQDALIKILESEEGLNRWNQLQPADKEFVANNEQLLNVVLSSDEALTRYNEFSPEEQAFLGNNVNLLATILSSEENLNRWNSLEPETKQMLADNTNLASIIFASEEMWGTWSGMPDVVKNILGDNSSYIENDEQAKQALLSWNGMSPEVKALIGDNTNAINAIFSSQEMLETWNRMPEEEKLILANNENFMGNTNAAMGLLNEWAQNNPPAKNLNANNNTGGPVYQAQTNINSLTGKTVDINADTSNANSAITNIKSTNGQVIATNYIDVATRNIPKKMGTGYYNSELPAVVNDQKGSLYRELIQYPDGTAFIPEGRDVHLSLPKGSKVFPASITRAMFPHYKDGLNVSRADISSINNALNQRVPRTFEGVQESLDSMVLRNALESITRTVASQATDLYALANIIASRPINVQVNADRRNIANIIAQPVTDIQNSRTLNAQQRRGERTI